MEPDRACICSAMGLHSPSKSLALASGDGTARLWRLADLMAETYGRLLCDLTREEWRRFMGDEPYQATCPNLSVPR